MKTIRTAIVGTGSIAQAHCNAIQKIGARLEIVGAMDVDAGRVGAFCAKNQIAQAFTDAGELFEKQKPDIVHICTPPGTHCALSVKAMEAGAWVLCEKPLCGSLAEMDRIEATEKQTGCYTSSVFQWRFGSAGQHVRSLIRSEALGRPFIGVCQTTWFRDLDYYGVPWRGKWSTELGGPTMGLGIHLMDLFLWLLGDWQDLHCKMGTIARPIEVEDTSMAIVRFANGAMGSVINSALCPRQESYLRLDFQKATVEVKSLYGYTNENWQFNVARNSPHAAELEEWKKLPENVSSSHEAQLRALIESKDKGERPLVSGEEARRTIEFLSALYKSAITGETVKRGSIRKGDPFYEKLHGPVTGRPTWA